MERMSSYRFRFGVITTEARHGAHVKLPLQIYPCPCNASRTRSAYSTCTRVAKISGPGTPNGDITTEARHGAHVKLPLQIYPCPCNASRTRSAYSTCTRVAKISGPGTPNGDITTEARHGAHVKLPLQICPYTSPCNASGTRSACPTTTRVASISPTERQVNRGTCQNGNN